jgi:TM2 domain-containing membrane protein YozV
MNKHCPNCGKENPEVATFCAGCGASLTAQAAPAPQAAPVAPAGEAKSKMVAGLLAIFLGSLGIHNFYLGYTKKGVTQLLICLIGSLACGLGPIVAGIWAIVEAVQIFTGTIKVDANGVPLKD